MTPASLLIRKNDRIVFLGDSITDAQMYTNYVESYLSLRFPELDLRFFNAGWGGDTTLSVARRLERDVIALEPTLVTISLGMNDGKYTPPTDQILRDFADGLDQIVTRLKRQRIRMVLLTPGGVDEDRSPLLKEARYNARGLRRLADHVLRYARKQKIPAYDMQKLMLKVQTAAKADDPTFTMIPDSVHPDSAGHLVMAYGLLEALGVEGRKVAATVSAKTGRAKNVKGLEATGVSLDGDRLRFSLSCAHKPYPLPGGVEKVLPYLPFQQKYNSIELAIAGLPAGRHVVRGGPNRFDVFDAETLSAGIELGGLAGAIDGESTLRFVQQITNKNSIYFGLWRNQALGITHGEIYDRAIHRKAIAVAEQVGAVINQRVRGQPISSTTFEVFPAPTNGESISNRDFVTRWETTAPITAEFSTDALGGEATASMPGEVSANGVEWTSRQFDRAALGNCLGMLFPTAEHCFAYARIRLVSPIEQPAALLLGSDDGFAGWLNGDSIGANLHVQRGVFPDQERLPITLRAGENLLLVKITQAVAGWGFCVRFDGLQEPIVADWPAPASA